MWRDRDAICAMGDNGTRDWLALRERTLGDPPDEEAAQRDPEREGKGGPEPPPSPPVVFVPWGEREGPEGRPRESDVVICFPSRIRLHPGTRRRERGERGEGEKGPFRISLPTTKSPLEPRRLVATTGFRQRTDVMTVFSVSWLGLAPLPRCALGIHLCLFLLLLLRHTFHIFSCTSAAAPNHLPAILHHDGRRHAVHRRDMGLSRDVRVAAPLASPSSQLPVVLRLARIACRHTQQLGTHGTEK